MSAGAGGGGRVTYLARIESPEPFGALPELTRSEAEIARLVFRGRSDREIAEARGASVRTVANQLAAIYRKLGVVSRFELVALLATRALDEAISGS